MKGAKPDWGDEEETKWIVAFDYGSNCLEVFECCYSQISILSFATQYDAKESITKHEKEWRIFFGVEEDDAE